MKKLKKNENIKSDRTGKTPAFSYPDDDSNPNRL
jgi:hypothetical protein